MDAKTSTQSEAGMSQSVAPTQVKVIKMVKLLGTDGVVVEFPEHIVKASKTLAGLIDDIGNSDEPIPLMKVTSEMAQRVFAFCQYHYDHPKISITKYVRTGRITDAWDIAFCDVPKELKFDTMFAANFLEIKPLIGIMCRSVANDLDKIKSCKEIKKYLSCRMDIDEMNRMYDESHAHEKEQTTVK